jgi:hypothetical protein
VAPRTDAPLALLWAANIVAQGLAYALSPLTLAPYFVALAVWRLRARRTAR